MPCRSLQKEGRVKSVRGEDLFIKIINWIKAVTERVFNKNTIQDALDLDIAISDPMIQAIDLWSRMYIK
jgi:hypothetical protein